MENINIGVLCPSEIAFRRFMPALEKIERATYIGLAVCNEHELYNSAEMSLLSKRKTLDLEQEKASNFLKHYGGKLFQGYKTMIESSDIDALYIPLPPALHYQWAKLALECGKHLLVEKPATTCVSNTQELIQSASKRELALHENYMFVFHEQLKAIDEIVERGEIGDVRLYRVSFGFPMRSVSDFRYSKALGGGALLDAGGYTIKYASRLLGQTSTVRCAQLSYLEGFEVDMYGSATLVNAEGVTVQVAFGMDNQYKCELEIWGSKGSATTGRVLTAPVGFEPEIIIKRGDIEEKRLLPADDAFLKSIQHFLDCIEQKEIRNETYNDILQQAKLLDNVKGAC